MRRFLPLFLIVVIVMGTLPAATGQQEVIPLSSSLYSEMDLLFLITGSGTPSGSRPWTKAEASQMFSRIDRDGLKETGRELYDSIATTLETGLRWNLSDGFSLSAYLDLSLELYGHSNTDFSSQGAWEYSFVDRRPLARARLDMALSDYFYTYADLQYGYGPYTYDDTLPRLQESGHTLVGALIPDTSGANNLRYFDCETPLVQYTKQWATNVLPASKHFDFQWPKRAVFSMGTDTLNFSLSRDKISWGNSKIGNFVVDDHVDYHEYARFTTFSRYFKYEALMIFFDTHYAAYDHFQVLLAHRLEFRPWDVLTIAVSENVMYKDKVFQLQYLNPAFILHNLNNHSTLNAIAHAEIDWVPAPSLRLYGQVALDQATAPNEGDNEEVAAWALLAGLEWGKELNKGILTTLLEGSMATPHMYRREAVDFLMAQRYAGLPDGHWDTQKFDFIGSPYGGDALVFLSETRYILPDSLTLALTMKSSFHGEVTMYTPMDDKNSPYGSKLFSKDKIAMRFSASLSGSYVIEHTPRFLHSVELFSSLSLLMRGQYSQSARAFVYTGWDGQLVLGATITV